MFDEVPEDVVRAAHQTFERRDAGAAVAQQIDELSQLDTRRSAVQQRLAFASDRFQIGVEVRLVRGAAGLRVHLRPPAVVGVQVRHNGMPLTGRTDPEGRCFLGPVQHGHVSLLLTDDAVSTPTATAWAVV